MASNTEYNATISKRVEINPSLHVFWIQPDGGVVPDFKPGQFFSIGKQQEVETEDGGKKTRILKRAYSIASSPKEKEALELYIVLVEEGAFTPWLWKQKVGSRLWLGPKAAGKFTMDGFERGKDMVMVSTGTGLAPFISMFRTYKDDPPWRRAVFINGARYVQDLGYSEELTAAANEDPNVFYIPTVTREPEDAPWDGERGRVPVILEEANYERLVGAPLSPEECHVFLCGNPDMINDLEEKLTGQGFVKYTRKTPGNLHLERYW